MHFSLFFILLITAVQCQNDTLTESQLGTGRSEERNVTTTASVAVEGPEVIADTPVVEEAAVVADTDIGEVEGPLAKEPTETESSEASVPTEDNAFFPETANVNDAKGDTSGSKNFISLMVLVIGLLNN
jgi:hypothetical protein